MSEDFNREDDLQYFAQPYLFESEYTDDELREMNVLHQNARASHSCIMVLSWTHVEDRNKEKKLLNKVLIVVFLLIHKVKLRLNHWCHMDYFIGVLLTWFLILKCQLRCCLCSIRKLSNFIKNISICVPKKSLERHDGEWQNCHFGVNYHLRCLSVNPITSGQC